MIAKLRQPLAPGAFGRFWQPSLTTGTPPAPPTSCYALSDADGSIATSLLGYRATFPCGDEPPAETFYALSDADGSIASSMGDGARATFNH